MYPPPDGGFLPPAAAALRAGAGAGSANTIELVVFSRQRSAVVEPALTIDEGSTVGSRASR
jgi:hypothetical protein